MQQVRNSSQNYRVPSSNISIDEAMIRCTGRSQDTYKTPFKPISEGLKFHCAADHGFIFDFHPTSQKHGPDPIAQDIMEEGLSNTSSLVLEMISRLPKHLAFNLYLDNYYTSLPLLSSLRKKGVGACGTARTSSKMFPPELVVPKNKSSQLGYHERAGMVVDEVAIMLWMDNAPVSMMTTIHQLKGRGSEVQKERRRPGLKSSNAAGIRKSKIFDEGEWRTLLNIPRCIDDYNHHMGGVDIADQYRSYYDTQLISRRTWFPIFFWLVDTALINSFIIHSDLDKSLEHKEFRIQVAWSLILSSAGIREARKKSNGTALQPPAPTISNTNPQHYITKQSDLPIPSPEGQHLPVQLEGKRRCVFCRWQLAQGKAQGTVTGAQAPQTIWKCENCSHALCLNDKRNCFHLYHNHHK